MKSKNFNERCYSVLRKVPRGKVTTYKEIAKALNSKGYRAVGNAMNKNPYGYPISLEAESLREKKLRSQTLKIRAGARVVRNRRSAFRGDSKRTSGSFLVPCHRVINSDGTLGGFASGVKNKISMLKKEGVEIKDRKIDLDRFGFKFN